MKRRFLIAGSFFIFFLTFYSCVSPQKVLYLQHLETPEDSMAFETAKPVYRVLENDKLYIRVITPDPRWSDMFNSMPINSATMAGEAAINLIAYEVHPEGYIDIPYVGRVRVLGMTIPEIKDAVGSALQDYITDADVTVVLVNNYVSILGEVARPGLYPIYRQQLNIFQALSMAGDMTDFGYRDEVQIIRGTPEGSEIKTFNIMDRRIVDSEYYYVLPNDVIYVKPQKGKGVQMNATLATLTLSALTTFILLLNVINQAN